MARPGNTSALRHGLYRARQERDRFRRQAEQEARAILKAAGLEADPLAGLVARQIGRLEAKVARLQEYHDRRGHFTRRGDLRPSVLTEGKFISDLLGEARRLFDELRARGPAESPTDRVYIATLSDGTPLRAFAAPLRAPLASGGDVATAHVHQDGPRAHAAGSPSDDRAPGRPSPSAPEDDDETPGSSAPDARRFERPPIARRSTIH